MASWLFGSKGPDHYTDKLLSNVSLSVGTTGSEHDKAVAAIAKSVEKLRVVVTGEAEKEPKPEQCEKLARAWIERDAVAMLVHHMRVLEFEVRKTVSLIFCTLMQRDYVGFRSEYMPRHPELAHDLMAGYDDEIVALAVGPMIRSCLLSETLHRSLLYDDPGAPSEGMSRSLLCLMREFVHSPNFAVSSDAFTTLQSLLTCNKSIVHEFLLAKESVFFQEYNKLLDSTYLVRRQSLKLLGELLLDRENFDVMIKYIKNRKHLRRVMLMLRDPHPAIQYEAFHVFKVFVANPSKPPEVVEVLLANRNKLVEYLRNFQNDRDDEMFNEEKALLIDTLENKLSLPEGYETHEMKRTGGGGSSAATSDPPATAAEGGGGGGGAAGERRDSSPAPTEANDPAPAPAPAQAGEGEKEKE